MVRFDRSNTPRTAPGSPIRSPPSLYRIPEALPSRVALVDDVLERASSSPEEPPTEFLVRTAQASRLRRRGAIRIEPGAHLHGHGAGRWDYAAEIEQAAAGRSNQDGGMPIDGMSPITPIYVSAEDITTGTPLYCGGFEAPVYSNEAYRPSPLPSYPSLCHQSHASSSNGCGAQIHPNGCASKRLRLWVAQGPSFQNVIALEASYFDSSNSQFRVGIAKCGCTQEGLGCSSCGNRLGVVLKPCRHHAPNNISPLHLFDPSAVSHNATRAIPFPHEYPPEHIPITFPPTLTSVSTPTNSQTPQPPSPIFTPAVILLSPTPITLRASPSPMTPPRSSSRSSRRTSLRNILPPPLSLRQTPLSRRASAPPTIILSPARVSADPSLSPIPQDSPRMSRSTSLLLEGIPIESRMQLRRASPVQDETYLTIPSPRQSLSDGITDPVAQGSEHRAQLVEEPQPMEEVPVDINVTSPVDNVDTAVETMDDSQDSQGTVTPDDLDPDADSKSSVCDGACD
ncbi:hypothetical protein FRC02_002396 [Tulasnella sp. 418]|nr:hypothetical protein FRC02_002396 [Tulasnella sp. 418]